MRSSRKPRVQFNAYVVRFAAEDLLLPIVYSPSYKLRIISDRKYNKGDQGLLDKHVVLSGRYYSPNELNLRSLELIHSNEYIKTLKSSCRVAKITEIRWLMFLPNIVIDYCILRPLRMQSCGTVMAGLLALKNGWSINLGGGFHQSCLFAGHGLSIYADITYLIKTFMDLEAADKFMIVDLNATKAIGPLTDFEGYLNVYTFDMYCYTSNSENTDSLSKSVKLLPGLSEEAYLSTLDRSLKNALEHFKADIIIYNAGTDLLKIDTQSDEFSLTPNGIVQRDLSVFEQAAKHRIPIVMLLSGGYGEQIPQVIAESIYNLKKKGFLKLAIQ